MSLLRTLRTIIRNPKLSLQLLDRLPEMIQGIEFARRWSAPERAEPVQESPDENPLRRYFEAHKEGRGLWKWRHYFNMYHEHFARFVGQEVHVAEVGIYSGGSLDMWKHYFGAGCHVYGVDIEPACKSYESDRVRVFIGDQADRQFWQRFRQEVPRVDILIDDGGHEPEQQRVTLEEMLPHIRPGGVYLCEDIHGDWNRFTAFLNGLTYSLNAAAVRPDAEGSQGLASATTPFQRDVMSLHLYPFAAVIKKANNPVSELVAPKHGTQWQPFYD